METLSVINLMPATKEQINAFADLTINTILNGEVDALKIDIKLKAIEETIKAIRTNEDVKKAVLKIAENYGQKTFELQSAKISISELGTKYDYSGCCDVVLQRLEHKKNNLDKAIKNRQEYLKFCKAGSPQVDEETGETYEVYPPAKISQTGLKYQF